MLEFMLINVLLQHSIHMNHTPSTDSGSMHLLLNQWTVTIRFHILLGQKFSLLLHRQKQEKRKFNWFSRQCCLEENYSVHKNNLRTYFLASYFEISGNRLKLENRETILYHMENSLKVFLLRVGVGGAKRLESLSQNVIVFDVIWYVWH